MKEKNQKNSEQQHKGISRRNFLKAGGAVLASAVLFNSLAACTPKTTTITTTATTTATTNATTTSTITSTPATTPMEATQFNGIPLTPIVEQRTNALAGTQYIDAGTYVLTVDGLVDHPLSLNYSDLQAYDQISKAIELHCVEGWSFMAKWTGPALESIFAAAGVKPEATIAIFHTADDSIGYSSLDVNYLHDNGIIIALKLNDITLPQDRGFPLRVVAEGKFGYKWAKWVTRIELASDTNFRGYWEGYGYNNNADINGPPYESGFPAY